MQNPNRNNMPDSSDKRQQFLREKSNQIGTILESMLKEFDGKVDSLTKQCDLKSQDNERLELQNRNLEAQLCEIGNQLCKKDEEIAQLKEQLSYQLKESTKLKDEKETLVQEKEQGIREFETLTEAHTLQTRKIEGLMEINTILDRDINKARKEKHQLNEKYIKGETDLKLALGEKDNLKKEVEQLKERLSSISKLSQINKPKVSVNKGKKQSVQMKKALLIGEINRLGNTPGISTASNCTSSNTSPASAKPKKSGRISVNKEVFEELKKKK